MIQNHASNRALCVLAAVLMLQIVGVNVASGGQKPDPRWSTATSAEGVLFACPAGDGDLLSARGLTITATLKDNLMHGIAFLPATDIWVVGCNAGLSLCYMAPPFPSGSTDLDGNIVLDGRLFTSGCDNSGLRLMAQGIGLASCLSIQTRTPDLKSSGPPGPGPCAGDQICPDGKVNLADFSHWATHYPSAGNPSPGYFACTDIAQPYGGILGLPDFAQLITHLAGSTTHGCP